jgi:hypothetical protein
MLTPYFYRLLGVTEILTFFLVHKYPREDRSTYGYAPCARMIIFRLITNHYININCLNFFVTGNQLPPADPQVQQWFMSVDTDRSGKISSVELQRALTNTNWSHFNEEACRLMIGMKMCFQDLYRCVIRTDINVLSGLL